MMPRITLYSTARCPHCRQMKQWLKQHDLRFQEMDIQRNPRALKDFQRFGGRGVPLLRVGEHNISGFDSKRLASQLRKASVTFE